MLTAHVNQISYTRNSYEKFPVCFDNYFINFIRQLWIQGFKKEREGDTKAMLGDGLVKGM